MSKSSSTRMAVMFLDNRIVLFCIPEFGVTDTGPQFVSKICATLCADLGVAHLTTTANHPQTISQADRLDRTIVARFRHYIAHDQQNQDVFVQPHPYAYNIQGHKSANISAYGLVLSHTPTRSSLLHASEKSTATASNALFHTTEA